MKRLKFSTEKCRLLKINSKANDDTVSISGENVEIKNSFRYLGDIFNSQGNNSDLCKDRLRRAVGTSIEIISLCKEVNFGTHQTSNMLLLHESVFLPRLVYNCEAWTNLTMKNHLDFEKAQKNFLLRVTEVPNSTPTAGLFLELGILSAQFVIELRQLTFLKKTLARDQEDPVKRIYNEMLKYAAENNVLDLRRKYNLPQNDDNIANMTWPVWKKMVRNKVKRFAFMTLFEKSIETQHLWYARLERQPYITSLDPAYARCVYRARVKMFEIKANFKNKYDFDPSRPFCKIKDETFDHIFTCESRLLCKNYLNNNNLLKLSHYSHNGYLEDTGEFLYRHKKYREIML